MQIIRKGVCAQEGNQTFVETVDRLWIFGMQEKKTVSAYAAKKFATSVAERESNQVGFDGQIYPIPSSFPLDILPICPAGKAFGLEKICYVKTA